MLIKHRDEFADPQWDAEKHAQSIVSGRTLEDIKLGRPARAPAEANNISSLPGARKMPMPRSVPLTLASLSEKPFSDPDWLFEVKWDGVRGIAYVSDGKVAVRSRAGREISLEYPEIQDLANQLDASEAIIDGEIVALDAAGRSNFQKLQNRSGVRNPSQHCWSPFLRLTMRLICCTAMAMTCGKFRWSNGRGCSGTSFVPMTASVTQNMKWKKAKNYMRRRGNKRWKGLSEKNETALM